MPEKDLTKVIKKSLTEARTNQQIAAVGNGWAVETIDGPATLRVQSEQGYPYPLRTFEREELPKTYNEFFLSNPATDGELILHMLREDGLQPKAGSGKGGLPITDTVERGLDLTQKNQITLDTTSFGRPRVEIIAITYGSGGSYPGSAVDFTLYGSPDKVKWYQVDTFNGDLWTTGKDNAVRYIMLENSGGGLADETCDLILSASE